MSRIYMKRTSSKGDVTLTEHECWDEQLFRAARGVEVDAELAKDGGAPAVEFLTREQYVDQRGPQNRRAS